LKIITVKQILILHEFEIRKHGGLPGIRDIGMLKSAVGTEKIYTPTSIPKVQP
jgi:prophage maintenance system killer protein